MKKATLLLLFTFLFSISYGQKSYFANPATGFSKKKTSYVTLQDGTELVGTLKKFDWKKGLFEGIVLVVDDKKKKISADEISHMYLMPSGLSKIGDFYDLTDNEDKVVDHSMNHERFKEGYVYFEQTECYYKKNKSKKILLQLLNAGFCNKVRVYNDPMASESAGVGIGSFKVAGGDAKSYYIKKGDAPAFKMKKKEYKDKAEDLFGDCKDFYDSIMGKLNWSKLGMHILDYSTECG